MSYLFFIYYLYLCFSSIQKMFESLGEDIVKQYKQGTVLVRLIGICIAAFLFTETVHLLCWATGYALFYVDLYQRFALPVSFADLLLQPWSLFTFMFLHADVWHILYNMLWLYWFGEIYMLYMRERRFMAIFIAGSMVGGLLFMLMSLVLPPLQLSIGTSYLVGASAGIYAIMFAATALNPDHSVPLLFFGQVPIKYIALASFLISYVAITHGNAGGMISHIGGAVFGFAYIKSLRSGLDWFSPVDSIKGLLPRHSLRATHNSNIPAAPMSNTTHEQKRVDEILDKIAKSGYNSIAKEEKEFLFKYSNK